MKLVLIGMMGSGKSTIGRLLAREIGFPFIDTDHLIEAQTGKSIARIFDEEGETAFRAYESQTVDQLMALDRVVVACGGGTVMNRTNREKLHQNSFWIYLQASADTLYRRLSNSATPMSKRPLLAVDNPLETMSSLLKEREQIYLQADLVVPTAEQPAANIVQNILKSLPESLYRQPGQNPDVSSKISYQPSRKCVEVQLAERSYPIWIGEKLLSQSGELIKERLPIPIGEKRQAIVIGQPVPSRLYAPSLITSLQNAGYETSQLEIPDGESAKSLASAAKLYDQLVELKADRSSVIIALGGGVAGDLIGYAAATFMRGLPFVQVPTSLLAQVDASVGGKVAVNHPAGKNLIGAYHQPKTVIIDTSTVSSLPAKEFRNGMAEVIKYALLAGEADVKQLEVNREAILNQDRIALRNMINRCCKAKAKVVEADETDQGVRMILNLGHTFGHALESLAGYNKLKHGEAVAIGCCLAAELSYRLDMLNMHTVKRITELFASYDLPTQAQGFNPEEIYQRFYHDKKVSGGKLKFILMRKLGDIVIRNDIAPDILLKLLRDKING